MGIMDAVEGLGYAIDTPRALAHGAVANIADAVRGRKSRNSWRASGRDMLESLGILDQNQEGLDAGDVAGFGAEMLLDPVNLLGGAGVIAKLGKIKNVKAANALSKAQRAMGFMPEEVAKLTKVVDEAGNPKRLYHGTGAAFDKFDTSNLDRDALFGPGVYMTDAPDIASSYASARTSSLAPQLMMDATHNDPQTIKLLDRSDRATRHILSQPFDISSHVSMPDYRTAEGRKVAQWQRILSKIGKKVDDRRKDLVSNIVPENVRMHYVDARNPLNMDQPLDHNWDKIKGAVQDRMDKIRREHQAPDRMYRLDYRDEMQPENWNEYTPSDYAFENLKLLGLDPTEVLKNAGFDSIQHEGGQRVGNVPHNVTIALDPSQVYKPYIAPSIKRVPGITPEIASLLGYNAGRNLSQ